MKDKRDLWSVHQRLKRIEGELSELKAILNENFSQEEQTILQYEASIGRNGTKLEEIKREELEQYAKACQEYLRFGGEVEACLSGELPRATAVWAGMCPAVLIGIGYEKKDMYITQKHIRNILGRTHGKASHQHGIELEQFKQLPELLKEPLTIVTMNEKFEIVIAVLDAKDRQGNQLIVPIHKDGDAYYKESKVEANFILSVYGKQNITSYLTRAETEGKILFVNKNISTKLGQVPLQLRQFLSTGTYMDMIQQPPENVNVSDEKKVLKKERLDSEELKL